MELYLDSANLQEIEERDGDEDGFAARLRIGEAGVVARIVAGGVVLDLRSVLPEQDDQLIDAVRRALSRGPEGA